MPAFGVSLGVSSIAEIQIDWGVYQKLDITEQVPGAPLSHLLLLDGDTTDDFGDIHIGAKVRLVSETARRPAIGSWFTTRLPNAGQRVRPGQRRAGFLVGTRPSARPFNPFASSPTSACR